MTNLLVVVDAQRDFVLRGGALAVPGGPVAFTRVDELMESAAQSGDVIVATRDWHPPEHCSFLENGGIWPRHCVQHTDGAMLLTRVFQYADYIVSKGVVADDEEYSGWTQIIKQVDPLRRFKQVTFCGFALDICVYHTAMFCLHVVPRSTAVVIDVAGCAATSEEAKTVALARLLEAGAAISWIP